MTKPITTIALLLLLHSVFTSAREEASAPSQEQQRYELADASGHRSPVQIAGYVTFRDNPSKVTRYSYQVDASATNVSNKSVLLLRLRFETNGGSAPGLDAIYESDYFFGEGTLAPGVSDDVHISPLSFGAPIVDGVPLVNTADPSTLGPTATARVEFVQFTDGSTWGDRDAAADVFKVRRATVRQLTALEKAYVQSGEQAFRAELSKENTPLLPGINSLRAACKDNLDYSRCALDKVRGMLEAARIHNGAMRSSAEPKRRSFAEEHEHAVKNQTLSSRSGSC
jgi:hypothetical protein